MDKELINSELLCEIFSYNGFLNQFIEYASKELKKEDYSINSINETLIQLIQEDKAPLNIQLNNFGVPNVAINHIQFLNLLVYANSDLNSDKFFNQIYLATNSSIKMDTYRKFRQEVMNEISLLENDYSNCNFELKLNKTKITIPNSLSLRDQIMQTILSHFSQNDERLYCHLRANPEDQKSPTYKYFLNEELTKVIIQYLDRLQIPEYNNKRSKHKLIACLFAYNKLIQSEDNFISSTKRSSAEYINMAIKKIENIDTKLRS